MKLQIIQEFTEFSLNACIAFFFYIQISNALGYFFLCIVWSMNLILIFPQTIQFSYHLISSFILGEDPFRLGAGKRVSKAGTGRQTWQASSAPSSSQTKPSAQHTQQNCVQFPRGLWVWPSSLRCSYSGLSLSPGPGGQKPSSSV